MQENDVNDGFSLALGRYLDFRAELIFMNEAGFTQF
jgi:hypothetical protein